MNVVGEILVLKMALGGFFWRHFWVLNVRDRSMTVRAAKGQSYA